ncbi:MAG TPA: response regulator transcription factor [Gaiellaceae bacterium]|nr:response regulator transcription factor [Gaiellaceae bacterium]
MRRLKVLVVDDHALMRSATKLALEEDDQFVVVGEAESGAQVLPMVRQTDPDVVLLDIRLPGVDGLRCLELLGQRHPEVKTIVLSAVDEPEIVRSALQRGAAAFILKHVDPRDLASAIRQALEGTVVQTIGGLSHEPDDTARQMGLTEREVSIIEQLAAGLSNKQIGKELWLAEQTVKFHLTNIYRKLGVGSRAEAIRFAYQRGLVASSMLENPPRDPVLLA